MTKLRAILISALWVTLSLSLTGCSSISEEKCPPMGWNSWICFGTSVTEAEVKANADFMAENLKQYGWEYVVVDAGWYAPGMVALDDYLNPHPDQLIDQWGRLIVDAEKYPSAGAEGSFKAVADYVHSLGLKFGIHIMRGIPVQAYEADTPIKGTNHTAREIALTDSSCDWYYGFMHIDMSKPGAKEYYESLFELYASWGVDFVKADDLLSPEYAAADIEAIHAAALNCGRKIVLSLSPGPAPVEMASHIASNSTMWRISEDFWDNWDSLKEQFNLASRWNGLSRQGHWADLDMLPVGPMARRAMRGEPRMSNFTEDEQRTMLSLWAIFASPLMVGCNLPEIDPFTLSLLTNRDVLELDRTVRVSTELIHSDTLVLWQSDSSSDRTRWYAVFNLADEILCDYELSIPENAREACELWTGDNYRPEDGKINLTLRPHGIALVKCETNKI